MSVKTSLVLAAPLVALLLSTSIFAAGPAVQPGQPGEYTYVEGGSAHGQLTIKGSGFTLETIGGNCSTCSLQGAIQGTTAEAADGDTKCHVKLSGNKNALKLDSSSSTESCTNFCGARAAFDGEYRRPPPACTSQKRAARIEQSHKQYAARNYDASRMTLTSVLSECGTFMDWVERDKARSDLALTEFHRGDSAQCLAVLSKTVAVQSQKDGGVSLPPCDRDNYESTSKAILHNQALCQAPKKS